VGIFAINITIGIFSINVTTVGLQPQVYLT